MPLICESDASAITSDGLDIPKITTPWSLQSSAYHGWTVPRPTPTNNRCADSTPWAKQYLADRDHLASVDPEFADWYRERSDDTSLLRRGSTENEVFLKTDPSHLDAIERHGDVEEFTKGEEEQTVEQYAKPYWCDHAKEEEGGKKNDLRKTISEYSRAEGSPSKGTRSHTPLGQDYSHQPVPLVQELLRRQKWGTRSRQKGCFQI